MSIKGIFKDLWSKFTAQLLCTAAAGVTGVVLSFFCDITTLFKLNPVAVCLFGASAFALGLACGFAIYTAMAFKEIRLHQMQITAEEKAAAEKRAAEEKAAAENKKRQQEQRVQQLRDYALKLNGLSKYCVKHLSAIHELYVPMSKQNYEQYLWNLLGSTRVDQLISIGELSPTKCVVTLNATGKELMAAASDIINRAETPDFHDSEFLVDDLFI